MRIGAVLGVILIILGVFALAYQGITFTTHKKVLDVGPIQATKEEHKTIPLPPIVGGSCSDCRRDTSVVRPKKRITETQI